jgi:hypothetical protein
MYLTKSTLRARLLRDGEPGSGTAGGGGTPPASGTGTAAQGTPPANNQGGDDQLGEGGKAAIERERAAAKEAHRQKTAAEQRAEAAEAELATFREANQSEAEKATAKAVKEATEQVTAAGNGRLVRAEVKAAAATAGFHDPHDAALLLAEKFAQVKVGNDGQVDEAAVKSLVEDLAKSKPHLVKTGSNGATPLPGQGGHGQGPASGKEAGLAEARRRFGEKK